MSTICPSCKTDRSIWYSSPQNISNYFAKHQHKLCFSCANKKLERMISIRETQLKLQQINNGYYY
ncbi:uncharacterized protein ASCRUDRAFT_75457 [Ascoidea rubescens DSM 1968]|uniref:Uncharacterized protein n=1 Tax=Ascoidea rubescens DSM 1968 TaxID=1344418 RepID=A0A1D2VII2_9ASCO|nr:hypothetical protein ASCRUDRAFT_75457 [Ascoidea rubescens DSM 1968]ODV61444.1 hypothetical protein ASCRUDRAFT_75457 [Ascoidea rubescens DSM 1968]